MNFFEILMHVLQKYWQQNKLLILFPGSTLYSFLSYLKGRGQGVFRPLISSPNSHNGLEQARRKAGTRTVTLVSCLGGRDSGTWAIISLLFLLLNENLSDWDLNGRVQASQVAA